MSWVWILRRRCLDSVCNVIKERQKYFYLRFFYSGEICIFQKRTPFVNVTQPYNNFIYPRKTRISCVPRSNRCNPFSHTRTLSHQRRKHPLQSGKCRSCVTPRPFQISKLPRISSVSPNTELSQSIKRQV